MVNNVPQQNLSLQQTKDIENDSQGNTHDLLDSQDNTHDLLDSKHDSLLESDSPDLVSTEQLSLIQNNLSDMWSHWNEDVSKGSTLPPLNFPHTELNLETPEKLSKTTIYC